ncbi:MAG: CAP domain-containing protein [Candidatus Woesebacteria bacterium]|nr:CAP domain-containing protein [Candidatus Woesebacteria bacterium]
MQFVEKLIHFLVPRESNNHKAKILHSSSLIIIASFLILFQIGLNSLSKISPSILGYASNISIQEVVNLTNQKRTEAGLSALSLNQELSAAAYTKAKDMIDKDYWAHTAPDGTEPWKFFGDFGYKYRYAGENLARDFSNASSAVNAWMNSPTHRENILNPKYKEIGIGVTEGDLAGSDTTVIVQFFGATYADKVVQPLAGATTELPEVQLATTQPTAVPIAVSVIEPQVQAQVLISPFTTTRNISLFVVGLLLLVFVIDAILVSKRRITRVAGRTFAHVAFLGMILSIILILKAGNIL